MGNNGVRFLVHNHEDLVGVATADVSSGESVEGVFMNNGNKVTVKSLSSIPLGHKIAIKGIKSGERVIEYGEVIGVATSEIKQGEHVHTHNIKTLRW